jgi:hypothetical protein
MVEHEDYRHAHIAQATQVLPLSSLVRPLGAGLTPIIMGTIEFDIALHHDSTRLLCCRGLNQPFQAPGMVCGD